MKQISFMVPSNVHTLIFILSRFGSQFYKYHFLYCKRVGRQSIRHPLNSNIWFSELQSSEPSVNSVHPSSFLRNISLSFKVETHDAAVAYYVTSLSGIKLPCGSCAGLPHMQDRLPGRPRIVQLPRGRNPPWNQLCH